MNMQARVSLFSLKNYRIVVEKIKDFSMKTDVDMTFAELSEAISEDREVLENKSNKLEQAKSEVSNKAATYQEIIQEVELEIEHYTSELEHIQSEKSITDEYYTYYDKEGNYHEKKNRYYASLERQEFAVERKLNQRYSLLSSLKGKLNRCYIVGNGIDSLLNSMGRRIAELSNYIDNIAKSQNRYNQGKREMRQSSNNAESKLKMIETFVQRYSSVRLSVVSAYDRASKTQGGKSLYDLDYISALRDEYTRRDKNRMDESYYDDSGKAFRDENGLLPNNAFTLNGYSVKTDHLGRLISVSGKLRLEESDRNWDASINDIGHGDERKTDNRGHVIGHRFGGPDSIANAFPQDSKINGGDYKAFENTLAEHIENKKEVFLSVSLIYDEKSYRPIGVAASYSIDGERHMRFFPNEREEV